jgi:TolB-like protein/DNA-binding winged helix-turn-helix (wHTH) protein
VDSPVRNGRERWQVADLLIDVGRQTVSRAGVDIPLPKLSFDLLLALVRAAPDVRSNEQLMAEVWAGLVVSPETVVQRVKILRAALGEDSSEPRYLVAMRGRGYRLATDPVRLVDEAGREPEPPPLPPPATDVVTRSTAPRPRWLAPATGLAMLAAVALLAWRLDARPGAAPDSGPSAVLASGRTAPETAGTSARTVAVLPFRNLSADPADAFIALGLPEMTLARLASVRDLRVIARDSSFQFADDRPDARELGRRLGASWLVEGSVQRTGDALRVTARLVDARDATQAWSTSFDGAIGDLYRIQDEIAERVARSLETRLTSGSGGAPAGDPAAAATRAASGNVEAYLAWLRGRALLRRFTVAEAEAAATEFERATRLAPTFAEAFAALYDARMQAAGLRHDDLAAARDRHRPLLERALALDARSGSAWFARAMWERLSDADRVAAFREAARLDPGNTRGLIAFSEFLDITDRRAEAGRVPGSGFDPGSRLARDESGPPSGGDRSAEASAILARVLAVDPLSPRARFRESMRGFRGGGGSPEQAIVDILGLDPDYYPALQRLAKYRWMFHGKPAEAIGIIERAIRLDPQNPWAAHTAVAFYLDVGDPGAARDVAASTPFSARSARIVLAQQAGDWRAAGEAALAPEAFAFGFNESWGYFEALRDLALRTGRYAQAEALLRERFDLPAGAPPLPALSNYRAGVALAQLELAQGRRAAAEARLRATVEFLERIDPPAVYKRRSRAQARLLLGDADRALADLAASFDEDRDYTQAWYALERDPTWEPVRSDPRFRALAARVRDHLSAERAAVEGQRARGEIPSRAARTAPPR